MNNKNLTPNKTYQQQSNINNQINSHISNKSNSNSTNTGNNMYGNNNIQNQTKKLESKPANNQSSSYQVQNERDKPVIDSLRSKPSKPMVSNPSNVKTYTFCGSGSNTNNNQTNQNNNNQINSQEKKVIAGLSVNHNKKSEQNKFTNNIATKKNGKNNYL